jgi:hypothetical protein
MTGFPKYGNDLRQQSVPKQLLELDWQVIAPGMVIPRLSKRRGDDCVLSKKMQQALEELTT